MWDVVNVVVISGLLFIVYRQIDSKLKAQTIQLKSQLQIINKKLQEINETIDNLDIYEDESTYEESSSSSDEESSSSSEEYDENRLSPEDEIDIINDFKRFEDKPFVELKEHAKIENMHTRIFRVNGELCIDPKSLIYNPNVLGVNLKIRYWA